MEPLPLGMRFLGTLFRLVPGSSVANMSLEQIEKSQAMVLPKNPLVDLLLGGLQKGVRVEDCSIDGPGGRIRLRIYTPERPTSSARPLVVYYHGGGWVLGNIRGGDWMCSTVARDVDAVVISVDYRLAPKHKFPAAVEDCYAALVWSSANAASLGADGSRIGVMGESAGGNLAAVVCLLAKERGGPKISHQTLLYPATDVSKSAESYQACKDSIILSVADMGTFRSYYVGPDTDPMDWRLSPLHAADHPGLPPAIIIVGGNDPLHDDGVAYAEKLTQAGVPVDLKEYPAMPHGFANFPNFNRESKDAFAEITRGQRNALGT